MAEKNQSKYNTHKNQDITIEDVAERAGVSPATVSRVTNNTVPVRQEKREKVMQAVKELGYSPNRFARSLRKQKSGIIGIIVPDISNPYFSTLIRGIEKGARGLGFSATIYDTNDESTLETEYAELLVKERVDGVLFVGTGGESAAIDTLVENEIPVVALDRKPTGTHPVSSVVAANKIGARNAVKHLFDVGCQDVGFIKGPEGVSTAEERYQGYVEAISRNKNTILRDELIVAGNYTFESGRKAIRKLKQKVGKDNFPRGIIGANDLMAAGAIRELQHLNLQVPEDVAIAGFDDIFFAKLFNPPLTTIKVPATRIGETGVEILNEKIKSEKNNQDHVKTLMFETELVVRQSSNLGGN